MSFVSICQVIGQKDSSDDAYLSQAIYALQQISTNLHKDQLEERFRVFLV